MKKTIKLLGLLFVAAMLFAGCANGSSSSDSSSNINEPLFSADDVTLAATKYELADGKWVFREIDKDADSESVQHFEFSLKNGQVDTSADKKFISSQSGTMPEGTPQASIDAAKAQGYKIDGNKYTYTKEYDNDAITKLFQKYAATTTLTSGRNADPDALAYNRITSAIYKANNMNNSTAPSGCKTNAEKTKYMWERGYTSYTSSGTTLQGKSTYYLAKK